MLIWNPKQDWVREKKRKVLLLFLCSSKKKMIRSSLRPRKFFFLFFPLRLFLGPSVSQNNAFTHEFPHFILMHKCPYVLWLWFLQISLQMAYSDIFSINSRNVKSSFISKEKKALFFMVKVWEKEMSFARKNTTCTIKVFTWSPI